MSRENRKIDSRQASSIHQQWHYLQISNLRLTLKNVRIWERERDAVVEWDGMDQWIIFRDESMKLLYLWEGFVREVSPFQREGERPRVSSFQISLRNKDLCCACGGGRNLGLSWYTAKIFPGDGRVRLKTGRVRLKTGDGYVNSVRFGSVVRFFCCTLHKIEPKKYISKSKNRTEPTLSPKQTDPTTSVFFFRFFGSSVFSITPTKYLLDLGFIFLGPNTKSSLCSNILPLNIR